MLSEKLGEIVAKWPYCFSAYNLKIENILNVQKGELASSQISRIATYVLDTVFADS